MSRPKSRFLQTMISATNIVRILGILVVVGALGVLVWFDVRGHRVSRWLEPQPILSVVALIVGFALLGWQLQKQHHNTLETNRRQAQDRLKLDIFSEIAKRIEATRVPLTHLGLVPTGFVGEFIIRRQSGSPSRYQFSDLQDVSQKASDSVIALMAILEIYEIAMAEFVVFRERLAESSSNARVAFGDFTSLASGFLGTLTRQPTPVESAELSRLANITQQAALEVTGVVWDLRVAAQNYLLGGLFPGRRVLERKPGDPLVVVTKLPTAGLKGKK